MNKNRKVICAGCLEHYPEATTGKHRNKRCCGSQLCIEIIDQKITNFNYKKQQRKINNGTFRHGVPIILKQEIIEFDNHICQLCNNVCEQHKHQVHHIVPVSEGGQDEHTNLILLCSFCHTKVHQNGWQQYRTQFNNYTNNRHKNMAQQESK